MKGINFGHRYTFSTYKPQEVRARMMKCYQAGYRIIRIVQPSYNSSAGTLAMCKDFVQIALDVGFDRVYWGVVGARPVTSTNYAAFATNVKTVIAPWAQSLANPRLYLGLGNEEELHVDHTTITESQFQTNLKTLATEVQAIYTYGPLMYVTDAAQRDPWAALGLGNIDILGMNLYYEESALGGAFKGAALQIKALFPTNSEITEWGIGGGYPTIQSRGVDAEDIFASNMLERQNILEEIGFNHLVFGEGDGYFGVPADMWALCKGDGTYRKAWYVLTGTRKYSDKHVSPAVITSNLDTKADVSHSHVATDVTDFTEATQDVIGNALTAGSNITVTYNDVAGTTTIASSASSAVSSVNGSTGAVVLNQDNIADGTTYKQYPATDKTKLSGIAPSATANDTDANLKARANHTGTQAISTITSLQTTLDDKALTADLTTHTSDTANPHGVTKTQVGLANVDNTSDTAKPVSTSQQAALDLKANASHTHAQSDITNLASDLAAKATDTAVVHLAGTETVTGAKTFSSVVIPNAGIAQIGTAWSVWATGNSLNVLNASSGTSTSGTSGTTYWAQLYIGANTTVTGITYSVGNVGGTNLIIAGLYSSAGVLLGNTSLTGTTMGTASTKQSLPLTAPVQVVGPGSYFIGLQTNGTTAKFLTFANAERFVTGSVAGTFGTLPTITPGTTFTAGIGPYASTY